jgi:hypothetical protein
MVSASSNQLQTVDLQRIPRIALNLVLSNTKPYLSLPSVTSVVRSVCIIRLDPTGTYEAELHSERLPTDSAVELYK